MNLIIPIPYMPYKVSRRSTNTRIPPLIMERGDKGSKLILVATMISNVRCELYKLFQPIKESRNDYHQKTILPIQGTFYRRRDPYTHNAQSKKMPPNKLRDLFGFLPIGAYVNHCVPPYLHHQASTDFCHRIPKKDQISINCNYVCPLFNRLFILKGEKHRELI